MNALCYKTVFSKRLGALVAVGEHAASQGKGQGAGAASGAWTLGSVMRYVGVLSMGFAAVSMAWSQTLPQGGRVSQGQVTISQSGQQMAITQSTAKAVVNWDSFDIGANAKVNIAQPSSQSVLLNRVLSDNPTQILGQLQANGQVVLVNPKGIVVGSDGSVSASAFTASTLNISDADFMAGNGRYSREGSTGEVVNKGRISVAPGGYVALLGARVSNEGTIIAPQGGVALGAAETVTVPIGRTGKIKLELTPASINASVANQKGGVIIAEGGHVYMQAAALGQAVASVLHSGHIDTSGAQAGAVHLLADGGQIKVEGSITANSSGKDHQGQLRKGGDIFIGRDEETGVLARTTDTSGAKLESQRGFVETSGDHLVTTGTRVKAGEWLLDPTDITIGTSASGTTYTDPNVTGGNYSYAAAATSFVRASDIQASLNDGTNVTIATSGSGTDAGNINVNTSIAKTAGSFTNLTLRAHNDIVVAANTNITSTSGNLNVTLNSDFDASGAGAIVMNTGSGITSLGGNITLGGGSAGSGASYAVGNGTNIVGISLVGATLAAGGGNITLRGKGSASSSASAKGVAITSTSVVSTSGLGNITLDGLGGTGTGVSTGVSVESGSTLTGSTAGSVNFTGTGGTGGHYNFGVWVHGTGTKVTTTGGSLTVTGVGGGTGANTSQSGVMVQSNGSLGAGGSGTVTVTGTGGNTTGRSNHGVELAGGGSVNSVTGSISVTGTNVSTTAPGYGIALGNGKIASTGNAAITLTTDSFNSTNSSDSINAGTGIVTIQNRTGTTTVNVGGTGTDTLSGTPLGLDVSAAELGKFTAGTVVVGRRDATGSGTVTVNALNMGTLGNTGGSLSVLSVGDIAVNGAITKTAGTDATLSLLANRNITVASNTTITGSSGKLNVLLNSDSDGNNAGAIVFSTGSGVTSNGGNITLGGGAALDGTGFATAEGSNTLQGISLNTATLNAGGGNIAMKGKTAVTNYQANLSPVAGLYMTGGAITTTGNGTIDLSGQNQNTDTQSKGLELASGTITGGSTGAVTIVGDSRAVGVVTPSTSSYIRGALINNTITSTGGNLNITGYGGSGAQYDYGVDIGGSVMAMGSGAINITGTAGAGGSGGNAGVNTSGSGTISSVDGAIAITGTGGIGNGSEIRNHGVQIGGTNAIRSTGSGSITLTGTVTNSDNAYSDGVLVGGGGLSTNTGNIKLDGTAFVNYQKAVDITAAVRSTTGNIYIRSAGANITTTSTGVLSANNISIDNSNGTMDASTGVITPGSAGAGFASGVGSRGVDINGSITAANNLNIYGNHTSSSTGVGISGTTTTVSGKNVTIYGKSSADNGLLLTGATLSGAYINATGETSTAYTGFAWNGGSINTTGTNGTSTASVVKGISAASSTLANGYGALMMFANGSVAATSGTTLTLAGEATTLSAGQNTKERGILVQGGRTLSMSGDVTLDGSSKSSEGIAFGGTVNITGANSKLTIKGTTAASSNAGLSGVNFSGTINNNGTSTQPISIIGEAKTLAGSNPDLGVTFSGAINSGTANVEILGKAASTSQIGVNNTGGSITSTGTATSINITSTGNLVNSTALKITGSTGTGANINLTAASGSISGSGAIGDTTNKNATVRFTQSGIADIYSGAINAANFSKAGSGTLTLNSWIAVAPATPAITNISNAYTVESGTLRLDPGNTLALLAPASVNVVNASTFALATGSNSRWNGTAFNFTGGSGGGTMYLGGNPLAAAGTSNTFSTTGGATNTILGGLNANGASVNFNLADATSGTALLDGSFAAIAFTKNSQGGYGLGSSTAGAATVNMSGGGNLLIKDSFKATTFNINAGNVQVGDGNAATAADTATLDASNISIGVGTKLTFNRAEAYTNAFVITGTGSLIQAGTGVVTLTGNSSAFAGDTTVNAGKTLAIGTGGSLGAAGSTLNLASNTATVAFTNTSGTSTIGSTISGAGTLSKSGAGTGVLTAENNYTGNNTVSGGTLQIGNGGTTGTLGTGGIVTLSNSANLSYLRSASTTIANNISGTGNVSASITGASSTLTVSNPINLTGSTTSNVVNLAADNNISVAASIDTTNTTSNAVWLNAGKSTNVGTSSGGDITFSGGTVTVGAGGRATLMTGSVSGSTGLTALVGAGSGNFRYNSDEMATNYTTALGTGLYGIYREAPVITATVNSVVKTYDGTTYSGGNGLGAFSGLLNGESAQLSTITYAGTSQGAKNASTSTYALNAAASSGLGYVVSLTPGTLTINKANLTQVTATKTYDGLSTVTGLQMTAIVGVNGETFFASGTADISDKNVATAGKTLTDLSGLSLSSLNGGLSSNYNLSSNLPAPGANNAVTINKANLTVTVNDDARFVGRADNPQYGGVSYEGFVPLENETVLGGTLAINRTNSAMIPGDYVLSATGLNSGNYEISYTPGNYKILPADQLLIKTVNKTGINAVEYGAAIVYETTAQYLDGNSDEIISLTRTGTGNQYTFNDGLGTTVSAALKPYVVSTSTLAGTSTSLNTVVGTYDVKDISPVVSGTKNFVGDPVFVGRLTVNTKEITPSATGVSKVYDGTTAMSGFVVGMAGNLDNDIVTIGGTSGAFTQKHAGTGRGYTVSGIALAGADAGNYHLSGGSSLTGNNGTITQALLKLTTSNVIKTYDGTTSALGSAVATQSTQLLGTDTLSGGTFAFTNKNAGTGNKVVTVSGVTIDDGNNGGNYNVEYVNNTTSTINKANLTLKAVTDTKVYDGTVASNKTVEVTNASGSSDVVTVTQEFASKNVMGPNTSTLQIASGYTIKDTGGEDMSGNYTVSTPTAEGTINKKNVELTSITAVNKTYDGSNSASITSGAITTGVVGETLAISGSGTFADKHAADGKEVTAYAEALTKTNGSGDWANYNLNTSGQVFTTANIAKRALSLTAVTETKTYDGTTVSSGTVVISGTQVGDSITANQVFESKHALGSGVSTLKVDTFTINDGNDGKNYSVTQNTATGTIQKANLTVSATQVEKTYNGNTEAPGTGNVGTLAGQGAAESVSGYGSQAFLDKNAGTGNKYVRASGVTIKDSANADVTQNYDINYVNNETSTIHQKEVSLSAAKTYDGDKTLSGTQLSISTGVGTETLGFTSASINSKNVADNSVNFVDAVTLSNGTNGGLASNYKLPELTSVSGSNKVTLTPKALTGAIAGVITTYSTTADPGAVSLAGKIGTDDVQAANMAILVDTRTSSSGKLRAGNYSQTVSGGLTGTDASNYSFDGFETPTANFVVTPLALTGTAIGDVTTTYGTPASAGAVSFTNVQGSDKVTATAAVTGGTNSSSGHLKAGSYQQTATTITGVDADNYSFAGFTTSNSNYVVSKKDLVVSASATGRVYDATTTATVSLNSDKFSGDILNLSKTSANFDNKNVGDNKTVTVSGLTVGGTDADNYNLTNTTATTQASISQKDLVISASAANKVYNANTAAIASLSSDMILGDSLNLSSTSANFDNKNVADNKTVTVSGLAISGTDAGNYRLTNTTTTTTANITPKAIALSGITANGKKYDGNTDAVVSVASAQFDGKIDGDVLSVTSTGSFTDKDAGPNKTVNLVNTLGGADLGNYSITQQTTAQAEISKAPLLVKVGDTAMFVTQDPNTAFHRDIDYVGFQNNETAADVFGTVTRTYVGSANPVTGSYANVYGVASTKSPSNYEVSVQSNLNVVAADKLLIHVGNASATYGDLTPANAGGRANTVVAQYCLAPSSCNDSNLVSLAMTRQGGLWTAKDSTNSSIQFNTAVDTTGQTSKGGFVNAGSYSFGAEGLTTQGTVNFNGYFVSGGLLTITPKSVTLNASDVTKVYDGNTNLVSATLVPTDAMTGDELQAAFTSGTFAGKDAGSQSFNLNGLTLQGADQANYVLTNSTLSGTGSITPKAITVSGLSAQDKVYDGTTLASVQTSGSVFNGIVAGDQLSVTATGQFDTRHVGNAKTVSLSSSFGGADVGNYTITPQASTTARITPAPLVVTASDARKTYDGNTTATGTGIVGALAGAGDIVASTGSLSFADKNAGTGKTVTVTGVQIKDASGADMTGNYAIIYNNSINGVIERANATISGASKTVSYNGAFQTQEASILTGFVVGDSVQASGAATGRNAGTYDSRLVATGADVGNYNITYVNAPLVIKKLGATITATGASVVYNGQTQSQGQAALSGFIAGDDVGATGLASGRNVGSYSSVLGATGTDASNYEIQFFNAPLTITPRAASLGAASQTVVYNGTVQTLLGTQGSGFIDGDALVFAGLPSGRNVGQYSSALGVTGSDASNYSITYGNGLLIITPRSASITAPATKVVYNGQTQTQGAAVLSGFISGDEISVSGLASGRNAGGYQSGLSATGADVGNYSITYQNGALTINKAPLQFVGTDVSDKTYDGNTKATVTAGSIIGLVGSETLNVVSVTGEFADPEAGNGKPVQVVYGLADGLQGGMVSNYEWSPQAMTASITRPSGPAQSLRSSEAERSGERYSRITYLGFGGVNGFGAATGQSKYSSPAQSTQACSPSKLEDCVCAPFEDQKTKQILSKDLEICRPISVSKLLTEQ